MMSYRPWEETLEQYWDRLAQAERASMIAVVHRTNPGTDRTAELDILALEEFGWVQ